MKRPQHIVLMEGGPPAKRRRCHFLEEEESNVPVKGQLDGSSSRSKFDSDEEVEGSSASDDDSNGIVSDVGLKASLHGTPGYTRTDRTKSPSLGCTCCPYGGTS